MHAERSVFVALPLFPHAQAPSHPPRPPAFLPASRLRPAAPRPAPSYPPLTTPARLCRQDTGGKAVVAGSYTNPDHTAELKRNGKRLSFAEASLTLILNSSSGAVGKVLSLALNLALALPLAPALAPTLTLTLTLALALTRTRTRCCPPGSRSSYATPRRPRCSCRNAPSPHASTRTHMM